MYKYLNTAMDLFLKSLSDVSKYMIILLAGMAMDNIVYPGNNEITLLLAFGTGTYILIYEVIHNILKLKISENCKYIISVLIIIGSLLIPIKIIRRSIPMDMYTFLLAILFVAIAIKALFYNANGIELSEEVRKFLFILLILGFIFLVATFIMPKKLIGYTDIIRRYLGIYLLSGVMHISRLNLIEEYSKNNIISINKNKNLFRVNVISIIVIFALGALMTLDFIRKFIITFFTKIFAWTINLTMIINTQFMKIDFGGKKRAVYQKAEESAGYQEKDYFGKFGKIKDYEGDIKDYIAKIPPELKSTVVNVIMIILAILLVIFILYLIRKNMHNKVDGVRTNKISFSNEEKDFIFNISELKRSVFNLGNELEGKLKLKKLHPIRKLYIEIVLGLQQRGIKYNLSYTPNEYEKVVENTISTNEMGKLTEYYNKIRYGNKPVSQDEINEACKIKDKILR